MDNDFKAKYSEPKIEELLDKLAKGGANPTGTIISFMGNTPPEGYLACDGSEYLVEDYPDFVEYLQTQFNDIHYFGGGDGTFCVPDLRGEFLRGTGTNKRISITGVPQGSGAEVGIHQDATQQSFLNSHSKGIYSAKPLSVQNNQPYNNEDSYINTAKSGRWHLSASSDSYNDPNAIITARPTNTSVLYCIKT